MVKIRLTRIGKKNDPFYRIIAIDSHKKREGEALEVLGYWHPREDKKEINKKKIEQWIKKGAQITPGAAKLLN